MMEMHKNLVEWIEEQIRLHTKKLMQSRTPEEAELHNRHIAELKNIVNNIGE